MKTLSLIEKLMSNYIGLWKTQMQTKTKRAIAARKNPSPIFAVVM
jgi:hypothetical protein